MSRISRDGAPSPRHGGPTHRPEGGGSGAVPPDAAAPSVAPIQAASIMHPDLNELPAWTDQYFLKTKAAVGRFGDKAVTYAVCMRRPVISAPRLAVDWLCQVAKARGTEVDIEVNYAEGRWVGAGEPILYISGSLFHLVDLETLFLQKLGPACVAAFNAYTMCADLPQVAFLAMDADRKSGV